MIIYLDANFCCHLENAEGLRKIETEAFNGKCQTFIEGCRYIPYGESWTNAKGITFHGEMVSPIVNSVALEHAQKQYRADEEKRCSNLGIPQEVSFVANENHPVGSFIAIQGDIYEVIRAVPRGCSIVLGQNVVKTTVERYIEALKEGEL